MIIFLMLNDFGTGFTRPKIDTKLYPPIFEQIINKKD